jgi:hypothetical protein
VFSTLKTEATYCSEGVSLPDYPSTSHVLPHGPIVRLYRKLFWNLPPVPTSMYGSLCCWSHVQVFRNSSPLSCLDLSSSFFIVFSYYTVCIAIQLYPSRRTGASSYILYLFRIIIFLVCFFAVSVNALFCHVRVGFLHFTSLYDLFTACKTHAKQFDGCCGMKR